mgnify:CR=1 FL=1
MIQKIVITAAGLGTRLLPITKEIPKEMMPMFLHSKNGELVVKPLIQTIFEQFFHQGLREYCIIMGRQKRIIQDHFTIDEEFLKNFEKKNKHRQDLKKNYLISFLLDLSSMKFSNTLLLWMRFFYLQQIFLDP